MVKSTAINRNRQNQSLGNIANDIYYLPNWEVVNSFTISENRFFFFHRMVNVNLYRRLVLKSTVEKYSLRTLDNLALANMDLKLYKDCVYIVNLEITNNNKSENALEKLLETAIEKAVKDTTEKEVLINIPKNQKYKRKIKKVLKQNGFEIEENQSEYEKNMFGEIYKLNLNLDDYLAEIKENTQILSNK